MLCENLLNDEYMIMLPKHTDNEKKHCVTAAYQTYIYKNDLCINWKCIPILKSFRGLTSGFKILSHCGVIKYKMPAPAPGNVTARINRMPIITYGNRARKYEAFPELRTPLIRINKTVSHDRARKRVSFQLGTPIPSSIESTSCSTSFLYYYNIE